MRKFLILLPFLLLSLPTPSACFRYFVVAESPAYSDYDALLRAVAWVESRNYDLALNVKEQACGRLQIRACRIIEYNRRTGKNYSQVDCFDYEVSREVFLYYSRGLSYQRASREWNGGPKGMQKKSTEKYWNLVKKALLYQI